MTDKQNTVDVVTRDSALAAISHVALSNTSGREQEALKMLTDPTEGERDASAQQEMGARVPDDHFGLDEGQLTSLLTSSLKAEEINGDPKTRHRRVRELMHWFARYATGHANGKWLHGHAFELAYYIASHAVDRHIDVDAIIQKAFLEGVNVSPLDRKALERIGAASAQQDEREAYQCFDCNAPLRKGQVCGCATTLSDKARRDISEIARHPYGGRTAVYLSGDDARAIAAQQVQAGVQYAKNPDAPYAPLQVQADAAVRPDPLLADYRELAIEMTGVAEATDALLDECAEALKYARRFLKPADHDTDYVDAIIDKVQAAKEKP